MKKIIFLSLLLGFLGACSGSFIEDNTPTKFPKARELYRSKCGGCHMLHNRHQFSAAKWDSILIPMQKKAKISNDQVEMILNYLEEKIEPNDSLKVN